MAILVAESYGEFRKLLDELRSVAPTVQEMKLLYFVVTDEISQVCMVPKRTSRHRHYICIESTEDEVKKAIEQLQKLGFNIIKAKLILKEA